MRFATTPGLLVAALLTVPFGARAQTVPPAVGADLLRSCSALIDYAVKGGEITVDATSCAAYLKGLRDAVDAPGAHGGTERVFCAGGAGLDDMARAVVKRLQERADGARRPAASVAIAALAGAYPCTPRR